MTSLSRQ